MWLFAIVATLTLCIPATTIAQDTTHVPGLADSTATPRPKRLPSRAVELARTTGTLVGVVTDEATGRPVAEVEVGGRYFGGATDSLGRYTIVYLEPGMPDTIETRRRDYIAARRAFVATAGRTDTMNFTIRRAPKPCCTLVGEWSARFALDSPSVFGPRPVARIASGSIRFGGNIPDPFDRRWRRGLPGDPTRDEFGRFDIDFGRLYGVKTTRASGRDADDTFGVEAEGAVFAGDSVSIDLVPRVDHGGVSLRGRINGDSIVGEWWERAYAGGGSGHVVLRRTSRIPPVIEVLAPRVSRAEPRAMSILPGLSEGNAGTLRVRVWDEGGHRYAPLKFDLQMPNKTWLSAGFHGGSGGDGWGPPVRLRPGRYAVELSEFPCDSLAFFFAKRIVRPFEVKRDSTAEITIRLNLLTAPAAKSFDNPAGARCGDPIE